MAIPTDHTMIWTEIWKGLVPRAGNMLDAGWCALPCGTSVYTGSRRVSEHFHTHDYAGQKVTVLCYPEDRCAKKFKASDRILGIFG